MNAFNTAERVALETLVAATIGTSCPVFFDNTRDTVPTENIVWSRFTIQQAHTRYAAIGIAPETRMRRTTGFLNYQIFIPENGDVQPGLDIADIYVDGIDSAILTITGGEIRVGVTRVMREESKSLSPLRDAGWKQLLCVTDYMRDVFG